MSLQLLSFLALFALVFVVSSDKGPEDCQLNEKFILCGQCEGTCANQRPVCNKACRGARCECIAAHGFVRGIHGHCLKASECPGPSIYSEDPYRFIRPYAKVTETKPGQGSYQDVQRSLNDAGDINSLVNKMDGSDVYIPKNVEQLPLSIEAAQAKVSHTPRVLPFPDRSVIPDEGVVPGLEGTRVEAGDIDVNPLPHFSAPIQHSGYRQMFAQRFM